MTDFEVRRQHRLAMRGIPERLGMSFQQGGVEMRSKPNGTAAGVNFEFTGYACVYDHDFEMWDPWGQPYSESVSAGATKRSLSNPNLDVPFLIGHNDAGIPLARTKSGTMKLSSDDHGTHVLVPSMDGRREEVRALASAVERGDMDEMSCAFVVTNQQWDENFEHRSVMEMDLHRGDVCAVVHGANPATAGSWMNPVEALSLRRPVALLTRRGAEMRMPTEPYTRDADETVTCPQCQSGNDIDARYCDQCGTGLKPSAPYTVKPDETQLCESCGCWNAPDAKICDQCGCSLVNDHDADDGYYGQARNLERLAKMSSADQNDLPDSDFAYIAPGGKKDSEGKTTPRSLRYLPIHDKAHAANALARLPQTDIPAAAKAQAKTKIIAACKKFGVEVSGETASNRPLARRAAEIEDMNLATAPDYNPESHGVGSLACPNPADPVIDPRNPNGAALNSPDAKYCDQCGTSLYGADGDAMIIVDDSTGIPGPEDSTSSKRKLELMKMQLDLEELASASRYAA